MGLVELLIQTGDQRAAVIGLTGELLEKQPLRLLEGLR